MTRVLKAVCLAVVLLSPVVAQAAPITYAVNRSWATPGGVTDVAMTGTITTDGTLGTITPANIVTFTLTFAMGNNVGDGAVTETIAYPFPLGGAYFAQPGASILRATQTELYVDFSDPPVIGEFEIKGQIDPDPWGGGHETYFGYRVQIRPAALTGTVPMMVEIFIIEHANDSDRQTSYTLPSRLVVGTAAAPPPVTPVPEPGTLWLVGAGLAAVVTARRRRQARR